MSSIQKIIREQAFNRTAWFYMVFCSIIFIGFVSSRVLISIGVAGLFVSSVYSALVFPSSNKRYILLFPLLFFGLNVFSWFNSENKQEWLGWLIIKLPFALLPVAFFLVEDFKERLYINLVKIFVWIMTVSVCIVLIKYALNFTAVNLALTAGGRMPVPYSHIRYSLLLTLAFFCSLWLFKERNSSPYIYLSFFLFFSLHIISVRSGLLALYIGLICFGVHIVWVKHHYKQALVGLLLVIVLGYTAFHVFPSLKNRIFFMQYDLQQWKEKKIDGNSDAMRIASLQSGYWLWLDNFWFGVGTGDIQHEAITQEKAVFPTISDPSSYKLPHNEFLWTACVFGLFGLIVFLLAWNLPTLFLWTELNWFYLVIQLIFFLSFMVEYTIEEQIGGTFFVLVQLLSYKWLSTKKWNPSLL